MDIHRCRFVPYPASTINAVAFSHSPTNANAPVPATLRLAIGRSNGDVEIWDPRNGRWIQETILRGGKDRSIEGLAWTQDLETVDYGGNTVPGKLRLFSIGYSTVVTEWDLSTNMALQHSTGNYGDIWCIAAQPRWQAHKDPSLAKREGSRAEQMLAIGCGDGSLVLMSTTDGELTYARNLPHSSGKKARVLSLAFQKRHKLVAGFSDSTIRIFDVQGKSQVINMSLGAGPKGGPSEILVWSIKCLSDGTIVSGDSTGEVKFWDPSTSALVQRIKSHNADVLDLSPNADGMSLLSGGMDRRTVLYRRRLEGKKKGRWMEIMHTRLHQNDVKTMATFEARGLSVTVSGGLDTTPILIPQGRLGQEYSRNLPSFPHYPPLDSAPGKRMFLSWWDREISIWSVGVLPNSLSDASISSQSRQLQAKITLQGEESITATSITENGGLLAASSVSKVKIFRLSGRQSSTGLKVQKLDIPSSLNNCGARLIRFSPDSRWLLVIENDSTVKVFRFREDGDAKGKISVLATPVELTRRTVNATSKVSDGTLGNYMRSICRIAWSDDSRIVVCCDIAGNFDSWSLEGEENLLQDNLTEDDLDTSKNNYQSKDDSDDEDDSEERSRAILCQCWVRLPNQLPRLPSAPTVLSFRPAVAQESTGIFERGPNGLQSSPHNHSEAEDRLIVVTADNKFFEYSVINGQLTDWSRRNPPSRFPPEYINTRDRAMGCVWDVSTARERLWLYASTWLWMFDLASDMDTGQWGEATASGDMQSMSETRKRKRGDRNSENRELMKHTSGAGSRKPSSLRRDGIGTGMTTVDENATKWTSFDASSGSDKEAMELDDDAEVSSSDDDASSSLQQMRRYLPSEEDARADLVTTNNGEPQTHGTARARYWRTYKYRPILGIVPLSSTRNGSNAIATENSNPPNVEVVLVERPSWDLDLGPRWDDN